MLSILYYIFTIIHTTVWCIVSVLVLAVTYPFDKSRRWVHEISRYMTWVFFGMPPCVKRTIDGLENIDRRKPYVMVLNHTSGVDIIAAYKVPLNFRWVSKREVFRLPFFGPMLLVHGDIPIERGNAAAAMAKVIRDGKLWLSRGASVAIFPEGTRSKDGEIHRFKMGAFNLAKEAGVDILPVVMTGTGATLKGWRMNWSNRIAIRVLPPVPAERVVASEVKTLADEVRTDMVEALAALRAEVAEAEKSRVLHNA